LKHDINFCVVGSGPGGAFPAVRLAQAGYNVLLLESGSADPDSDLSAFIDRIDVLGGAKPNFGFSRQLGGSSNLWSGRVARLEPIDFEPRSWVDHSGWPVRYEDLAKYYTEAFTLMRLPTGPGRNSFKDSLPADWRALQAQGISPKEFVWNKPPFNTSEYLAEAKGRVRGRLDVQSNAHVRRLLLSHDGQTIEKVEVAVAGQPQLVQADVFILAAGGIETPRMLLNSRVGAGSREANDVIGRFLSTHPKADMGLLLLNERVSTRFSVFSDQPDGLVWVRTGLGLTDQQQTLSQTLNHYVQLSPLLEHQANRLFELVKGGRAINSPLVSRNAAIQGVLPGLGQFVFESISRLSGVQRGARKFVLRAFLDQIPSARNRVYLSDNRDRFGDPKANIEWTFTAADRATVLRFFEAMDIAVRQAGLGRLDYEPLKHSDAWPITGIHSHFMGTTRMGSSPQTGVVDADCKMFGVSNCYISGPSVFPTYGFANPFLTIAALSLRLADHLVGKAKEGGFDAGTITHA
jgi:choline dehydrogenase-like flavoprotein